MQMYSETYRKLAVAIACALSSGTALADAHIGTDLSRQLATALPSDQLEVVVTFNNAKGPVTTAELAGVRALGINQGLAFQALPILGALATPAQINALARRPDVLSIFANKPVTLYDQESREIASAQQAQAQPADFGRTLPWSGFGVTVMVNDSGIDATHLDLSYGTKIVQNVQGLTNLRSQGQAAPAPAPSLSILPVTYVEGQQNTDISSGHGTHCAGIIAGTGARSNGLYRGMAPGAQLVGYGSGTVIEVMDVIGGFDYALINQFRFNSPIRVISNSWGSSGPFDPTDPVNVASYAAYKSGIVSVFAAGNDGPSENSHNPYAQAPWVTSVAAGDKQGKLADFSSRGHRFENGSFVMPDGQSWTYVNEPAIVATGVDVISTRDPLGALPPLAAQTDANLIAPPYLPFYTAMSGTSMATPNTAGVVALLLEANPALKPLEVKNLLQRTATNLPGYAGWEAGAGHVNAYAALMEASGNRRGYGSTVNSLHTFNSNAVVTSGGILPFKFDYSPTGTTGSQTFTVTKDTAWVIAHSSVDTNTLVLQLIDPDGKVYKSSFTYPVLGSNASVSAPAKPGTWTVTAKGFAGVGVPTGLPNGPGSVTGTISLINSGAYSGLNDIAGHPAQGGIQYAVAKHLVDGQAGGNFSPDTALTRGDLARYLVMGAAVRQSLPATPSFADLAVSDVRYPFAEAVIAHGAALKDRAGVNEGLMRLVNGAFLPDTAVPRADLAYSLVQALGLQAQASAFSGDVKALYNGSRIKLDDSDAIPAAARGYAQLVIDLGLMNVRYTLTQGPFDPQPVIHAWFDPVRNVTRAEYAVSAGILADTYNK
ncbi:S8 family serine peptidase [Dokdonella soli]|uniref:SLH domain-containing protein n=1 Tax=Dokdonella soli TaxID=529810 RepID=A0ABP3U455_9GAMM